MLPAQRRAGQGRLGLHVGVGSIQEGLAPLLVTLFCMCKNKTSLRGLKVTFYLVTQVCVRPTWAPW